MPRVPDFNVDRTMNTGVGGESLPKIGADTRQLQQVGAQALKIKDQLERAKSSAEALGTTNTLEKNFESSVMPAFEQKIKDISNKNIDPDKGLEEINKMIDDFQSEAEGVTIGSPHPEQVSEMVNEYIQPRVNQLRTSAVTTATKRKVNDQQDKMTSDITVSAQRFVDGIITKEEINLKFKQLADPAVRDVVGVEFQEKTMAEFGRLLGNAAPKFISAQGATPENIATAKSMISQLPEVERRSATRDLDETVSRTRRVEKAQAYSGYNELIKIVGDPKQVVEHNASIAKMTKTLADAPIDEFESPTERKRVFKGLVGKQIASEIFMSNSRIISPDQSAIDAKVDTIVEGLSNREIASIFGGPENLRAAILESVNDNILDNLASRASAPVDFLGAMDPVIDKVNTSNNPIEKQHGIVQLFDAYDEMDMPYHSREITSSSKATEITKTIEELKKDADPTELHKYMGNLYTSYKEYGQAATLEMSRKSPKFPTAMILNPRFSDQNYAKEVIEGMNNYKGFLTTIQQRNSDVFKGSENPVKAYEKKVLTKVQENMGDYANITSISPENNAKIFSSIVDTVKYMGVARAAKDVSGDIDDSIDVAMQIAKAQFPITSHGNNTLMVDAKYLEKEGINPDELNGILKSMTKLEFTDSTDPSALGGGTKIDLVEMQKILSGSESSRQIMAAIVQKETYDRPAALKMFQDAFDDEIVLGPDPHRPNHVAYYIKNRTGIIPLLADGGENKQGKKLRVPVSISVGNYRTKLLRSNTSFRRDIKDIGPQGKL